MLDHGYFEDMLDQLERDALSLDRSGDTSIVHLLFRTVHNLKSSSAQAGFTELSSEVHELENVLDQIRRGKAPWSATRFDQVTQVIDRARLTILGVHSGEGVPAQDKTAEPLAAFSFSNRWGLALSAEELAACDRAETDGLGIYRVDKLFKKGLPRDIFNALPVIEDIRELGAPIAVHPPWEVYSEGPEEQVVKFLFASNKIAAELEEVLFDPLIVLCEPRVHLPPDTQETLRFLIVEDDPTAGSLLRYILRQHGNCVLCESGNAGLAAFREGCQQDAPFDLVILDLFLPDIHGDAVLKEIRTLEAQLGLRDPAHRCMVLINTASKDLGQMRQTLALEPDGYLMKPIDIDFLVGKIALLKTQRT